MEYHFFFDGGHSSIGEERLRAANIILSSSVSVADFVWRYPGYLVVHAHLDDAQVNHLMTTLAARMGVAHFTRLTADSILFHQ